MRYDTIYEDTSVVKDITNTIIDGIEAVTPKAAPKSITRSGSLAQATSNLNLIFPVLVDKSIPGDTAMTISRSVERKATSLLQIAFSAFDITNSRDAVEFVQKFHTNLKGKVEIDDFIDTMERFVDENGLIPKENLTTYKAVLEDLKSVSYYYPDNISENSINDYKVLDTYSGKRVIKEASKPKPKPNGSKPNNSNSKPNGSRPNNSNSKSNWSKSNKSNQSTTQQTSKDYDKAKDDSIIMKNYTDIIAKQLLPTDVKKANEMIPTMMIVNFVTVEGEQQIHRQIILGVKAKLIPVDTYDVMNKIITKKVDSNVLLNFIKASTKEISFIKDFLFAIDNAKLTAVSNSKKNSQTNRLLKVLERRALNGKIRKTMKRDNEYKAISTLVISKETAEAILKSSNIDVLNPRAIRKLMEDLNLMMFIVADESSENVSIIMDSGDDNYETISYTHLEREVSDGSSKKMINLMTKMSR